MTTEEKFTKIAEKAIQDAEALECELDEFADGLAAIIADLETRLDQVNEELAAGEEEDEDEEDEAEEETEDEDEGPDAA